MNDWEISRVRAVYDSQGWMRVRPARRRCCNIATWSLICNEITLHGAWSPRITNEHSFIVRNRKYSKVTNCVLHNQTGSTVISRGNYVRDINHQADLLSIKKSFLERQEARSINECWHTPRGYPEIQNGVWYGGRKVVQCLQLTYFVVERYAVHIGEETTECYQCYKDFHSEGSFLRHNRDRSGDRLFSKGRRPVLH